MSGIVFFRQLGTVTLDPADAKEFLPMWMQDSSL